MGRKQGARSRPRQSTRKCIFVRFCPENSQDGFSPITLVRCISAYACREAGSTDGGKHTVRVRASTFACTSACTPLLLRVD